MGSILVIKPDDTVQYSVTLVNEYRKRVEEYFKCIDLPLNICRTMTYKNIQTLGATAYDTVLALLRQFDPHDDLYVLVCLTKEWKDTGVVTMLKDQCPQVVSVKAVWVGEQ